MPYKNQEKYCLKLDGEEWVLTPTDLWISSGPRTPPSAFAHKRDLTASQNLDTVKI